MSELTGVPSLSTAHRQVLLEGRGRCKTIKDLHTVEEGVRKKRKWGLISDTEDDSDESTEEYVEIVSKPATRSTPRRKAAVLTPRMKRVKVVERGRKSPDSDPSPVPPVRRVSVGGQDDHQEGARMKYTKQNILEIKADNEVNNDDTIESDVIKQVGSSDVVEVNMKNISHDEKSKEVNDPADAAAKTSTGGVSLPPGYGTDKLAMVLMRLLEEKIKVSTSHSERELFRKTIHVLVCGGCKDREKHNKVRCRRCQERDKRNVEDKRKVVDKRKREKDKENIVDKRKVEEENGKIITKNTFAITAKESPTKIFVHINSKVPIKKDSALPKPLEAGIEDKSNGTEFEEKCGEQFKQQEDLKKHSELDGGQGCKAISSEVTDVEHSNTKQEVRFSGEVGRSVEKKENNLVEAITENHAKADVIMPICATNQDEGKGSSKDGYDDFGMIDRDRIFSDLDDPVEDLSFDDDLVLDTVGHAAHVELIHDDEIDTELVIGGGGQGQGGVCDYNMCIT